MAGASYTATTWKTQFIQLQHGKYNLFSYTWQAQVSCHVIAVSLLLAML
jgi:hypothetical protein